MIAGYTEVDGRLVPIVVEPTAYAVKVVRDRHFARLFGIAFGDTFIVGTLDQLGAQMARNLADAHRPVP